MKLRIACGRSGDRSAVMMLRNSEVNVLVVEDDDQMREFLSGELSRRGYHVESACDGMKAVELIRSRQFNLVISDLRMPVMDGISTLEAIKRFDPQLELIMISGQGDIESAVRAMKTGAFDFLEKPVQMERLLFLIEKALEKSEIKILMALYEASRVLFSPMKLEELLEMVMQRIYGIFKADEGSFMTAQDGGLVIKHSKGLSDEIVREAELKIGERVAGRAAKERKSYLIEGPLDAHDEFKGLLPKRHVHSSIVIPVYHGDEFVGVLNLSRRYPQDKFTHIDLRNATIFAAQLGAAIYDLRLSSLLDGKARELKEAYDLLERTESKLAQKEQLSRVGSLIAGLAHELNNPLSTVTGYADLLLNQEELPSDAKEKLTIVSKQAALCRELVQDLLTYSRRRKPECRSVDLKALMHDTMAALAFEIKASGAKVRFSCPKDCPPALGDPLQLGQVFFNLIKNACQALETKEGRRHVVVRAVPAPDGSRLYVAVVDNGPGIPQQFMPKLFEPFFSTKVTGKGTGLGLCVVKSIVEEHGGKICARPGPHGGVAFIVTLPRHAEMTAASALD